MCRYPPLRVGMTSAGVHEGDGDVVAGVAVLGVGLHLAGGGGGGPGHAPRHAAPHAAPGARGDLRRPAGPSGESCVYLIPYL